MRPTSALLAGQNLPLPAEHFEVGLRQGGRAQADMVALLLDRRGKVSADADFVFYDAPQHPSGR